MEAFDKIQSGFEGLDKVLQNIRLGDNVVWQVSDIKDYKYVAEAFAKEALVQEKNVIYIRFAEHAPILEPTPDLNLVELDVEAGFEGFTMKVNEIISREGREAFYIFDCLSELQTVWATDLMMSNFFRVTCPYLFEMDTVAYFAILRNHHSYYSIAKIRETTQLFIDVYSKNKDLFIHPLKVFNRYTATMFLPHVFKDEAGKRLEPLVDGISASRFYFIMADSYNGQGEKSLDSWDNFFIRIRAAFEQGKCDKQHVLHKLCKMFVGKDEKMVTLVKKELEPQDFFKIKERMIGTGSIGGKALGMILARKIAENYLPHFMHAMEPHDSFYIGSDVFYTYIVQNGWWKLRIAQRTKEGYYAAAKELKKKILEGSFTESIREQFRRVLEYYGQNPIIVRSSSLLEDGFGNAFAGKYESIFCANTGTLEERLKIFELAVKKVYASAMDESALVYREQRGMSDHDEQMAILVQRVSGSRFEDTFMPLAAGVGHSYNAYVWHKAIDPKAGMVRIVLGLGTRAVERTDGDYPRVASLDKPEMTTTVGSEEKYKFSQHYVDVIDLTNSKVSAISVQTLSEKIPKWVKHALLENDSEAEARLRELGREGQIFVTTCDKILKKREVVNHLRELMTTLQRVYEYPVDIEFTLNLSERGEYVINLLQCRPLQVKGIDKKIRIPKTSRAKILFELTGSSMGGPISLKIDEVILVDTHAYYNAPLHIKYSTARAIGQINLQLKNSKKSAMLIGPGRWGTTSPELGVPIRFAEISYMSALCEVSYEGLNIMPELSYGSHFFQDLVETDIFYAAIIKENEGSYYHPEMLDAVQNIYEQRMPNSEMLKPIIKVYDVRDMNLTLISDVVTCKTICTAL
ncbi:MAG: Phosphoenolpyruvate synthase/pyruvate phosphate dikinase [Clostridia bacterium]|jgi:hypothetical protein|nr:Phosphoenolpyruvate synthase/pyruvate phosphate dikinase [Clostridia bacterium]